MDNGAMIDMKIPYDVLVTALFALERRVHLMGVNVEDCHDDPAIQSVWLDQQAKAIRAHETLRGIYDNCFDGE